MPLADPAPDDGEGSTALEKEAGPAECGGVGDWAVLAGGAADVVDVLVALPDWGVPAVHPARATTSADRTTLPAARIPQCACPGPAG